MPLVGLRLKRIYFAFLKQALGHCCPPFLLHPYAVFVLYDFGIVLMM